MPHSLYRLELSLFLDFWVCGVKLAV